MYGPDPRTSLPTVLDRGRDGKSGRRGPSRHRNSVFEDPRDNFHDFFRGDDSAGDFPLFGPASVPVTDSRQPRSRGNSRAQDTSPNAKPYISPHQLHESIPIEPDVREISISLDDVFWGTSKKYKIRRDKYDPRTGIITQDEKTLEVPISRGLKPKSKIKFLGEGHQTADGTRELHFQLAEVCLLPHSSHGSVANSLNRNLIPSSPGWTMICTAHLRSHCSNRFAVGNAPSSPSMAKRSVSHIQDLRPPRGGTTEQGWACACSRTPNREAT